VVKQVYWFIAHPSGIFSMDTSKIIVISLVFILGIAAGVVVTKFSDAAVEPVFSVDRQGVSSVSPALITRLDQMEARLGELTAALNRVDLQGLKGMGPASEQHQSNEQAAKPSLTPGRSEEVKSRVLNSLYDPATNITTLMNSNEMRALSPEQQKEIMKEVAARLDSGQLSKEQFLPGYKK
jgi:hypothetical protein